MKSEKESDIQAAICEYLERKRRCFFRVNNIPAFNRGADGSITMRRLPKYTPKGIPDIIVIAAGLFWGLEVKRPGTYQTPEQKLFQQNVEAHGGNYAVVRSIEDVQALGL